MHWQCHLLLSLSLIVATAVFRLRKIELDSRELHSLRGEGWAFWHTFILLFLLLHVTPEMNTAFKKKIIFLKIKFKKKTPLCSLWLGFLFICSKICILPLLVVDGRLEFQEWEYACVSSLQVGAKYKVSGSWVWSLFCNICSYLYLKKEKKGREELSQPVSQSKGERWKK